jgi:ABC-2 type transport system permease protein
MNNRSAASLFESTLNRLKSDQLLIEELLSYLKDEGLNVENRDTQIQEMLDEKRVNIRPVKVRTQSFKEEEPYNQIKQSVIGFSLFFAMFTIIFGISEILMEKEQFTWHRQLIAPISKLGILTGHMSFVFLLGYLQVTSMFVVSKYLFGVEWVGNMGYLMIVIAAFVFCVASLGMFLSNFVKTMGQLSALSPIIITGTAMIGGCFWPLEIVTSKILLFLSLLTPQRWAIEGIRSILVYNESLMAVKWPILILMGMGMFYLTLGAYLLKKKDA